MMHEEIWDRFKDFLETFPAIDNPVYIQEIKRCKENNLRSLSVDFEHLLNHDDELAKVVTREPIHTLPACDEALDALYKPEKPIDLHVRFYNVVSASVEIRELRAKHINKLIQIEGIVRHVYDAEPVLMEACFECQHCGQLQLVKQDRGLIKKPTCCSNPACVKRGPFQLIEDQNTFVDRQEVIIGASSNGSKIKCEIWDDNIDRVKENERVVIVGIYEVQISTKGKLISKLIEANHIELYRNSDTMMHGGIR